MRNYLQAASYLFLAGIATCTWDLLLKIDFGGFTLKIHQFFFALSFALTVVHLGFRQTQKKLFENMNPFALCILGICAYYLALSPLSYFPVKSFLYACWVGFSLVCIWWNGQIIWQQLPLSRVQKTIRFTIAFNVVVILIDQIAYQYGYRGGIVGFNQDEILNWYASRPHSFASEPSYIATFLSFGLLFTSSAFSDRRSLKGTLLDLLTILAVFVTGSRTGVLILFYGILMSLVLNTAKGRNVSFRPIKLFFIGTLASISLIFILTPETQRNTLYKYLIGNFIEGTDGSGNARLRALSLAFRTAKESNFIGVGLGASYKYLVEKYPTEHIDEYQQYIDSGYPKDHGKEAIMSIWGQILAEGGLPVTLMYLLAALSLLGALWKKWRIEESFQISGSLSSCLCFFTCVAFLLGNIARGDVWVWFSLWSLVAADNSIIERSKIAKSLKQSLNGAT